MACHAESVTPSYRGSLVYSNAVAGGAVEFNGSLVFWKRERASEPAQLPQPGGSFTSLTAQVVDPPTALSALCRL